MESNKQEAKNLVDGNPMAKRESSVAMMKSKKPSTDFAMKMSETKAALPMNMEAPLKKALVGNQDKLPKFLQDPIKAAPEESPAKMYGGKKGDESKSRKDY